MTTQPIPVFPTRPEGPDALSSREVRDLWHRKDEASLVFVKRDFCVTLCHAFPSYYFPELGLCVGSFGYGCPSEWATRIESDRPAHYDGDRGRPLIIRPERYRFLERVSCRKQKPPRQPSYRCEIEPIPGAGSLWQKRRDLGDWEGWQIVAFQFDPTDAEALAAICERREFVFDGRTRLAKAARVTGAA
jgi:hypothetical protein